MLFVSKLITPLQMQILLRQFTKLAAIPNYLVILPCFELRTYAITLYMTCLNYKYLHIFENCRLCSGILFALLICLRLDRFIAFPKKRPAARAGLIHFDMIKSIQLRWYLPSILVVPDPPNSILSASPSLNLFILTTFGSFSEGPCSITKSSSHIPSSTR